MKFFEIKAMLNTLKSQAEVIDKRNGRNKQRLFNESLFFGSATQISPCIDQTLHIIKTLEKTQAADVSIAKCNKHQPSNLSHEKINHLSDKLISQIKAIQREIATQELRQKEKQTCRTSQNKLFLLQQDLAQHHIWQNRLNQRLNNIREQINQAEFTDNHDSLVQLAYKTENRLARCQQSQMRIEHQILLLEKARNR